ncbi:hypothetical protein TeGR_g14143 [Tetraparma gracilis]|uniref:SGNH hydrolase-type esterase domain-containing protein n=1 Tax=Tetraparma gracilis TaxID=2962635 RepID=A0ABQ6M6Q4_9STRA|nr:hypothetical protein TeGR_g14143 [Tetraparma gracilis]
MLPILCLSLLVCFLTYTTGAVLSASALHIEHAPYKAPLCPPPAGCREQPAAATPRTPFSSRSPEQLEAWEDFHELLREEPAPPPGSVVFWGDSIFEAFRGTSFGRECERCEGVPGKFEAATESFPAVVQAISGDQTQHLLHRIEAAPWPAPLEAALHVVLIGTNNLGAGMSAGQAVEGVRAVVGALRGAAGDGGRVLLLGLLPRGGLQEQEQVAAVNGQLEEIEGEGGFGEGTTFVNCGEVFVGEGGGGEGGEGAWDVDVGLMPDRLHPNAEGVERWFGECLKEAIDDILDK